MILIPKAKQAQAQEVLLNKGFKQQHSRIFHYLATEGSVQYHCTVGLEDTNEDRLEVNVSVMRRPIPGGKKAIRLEDVKVIPVDEAPPSLQDTLADVEEHLERLS